MLKLRILLLHALTVISVAIITGILYFLGNKIVSAYFPIRVESRYVFYASLLECIGIAFCICLVAYALYTVVVLGLTIHSTAMNIVISVCSYAVVLFLLAGLMSSAQVNSYIVKNLIVFFIAGLSTPAMKKMIFSRLEKA